MPTAPEEMTLKVIAHIHTAFPTKFGIPRQSGLVDSLRGEIIFTPEYRNPDAVRGLEDFSHIWLVWQFSGAVRDTWSPTVRPPRLGGNTRMGVFATRSPFRPNNLGLSSVRLLGVEQTRGLLSWSFASFICCSSSSSRSSVSAGMLTSTSSRLSQR